MRHLSKAFKAVSDINRIRILKMLEVRPLCVCEIAAVLGLSNSTVSKHLSILRDYEFILDEKEGKWVNYYLNEFPSNLYVSKLGPLMSEWIPDDVQVINDRIRVKTVNRETICGS
jgi:ArsR family transcriptional regulator